VLPHPPQELAYRTDAYEPFVFSVGRLDRAKRIDLLIEAAARQGVDVVVSGEGPDRERLESLANGRVRFTGRVSEAELADLYARCRAVFYAPVDEDFGMVPFEAFLAEKPVVTTTDAGGPLDVVRERETGRVVEPTVDAVAAALAIEEDEARTWGRAGKALAEQVTWDNAIDRLLS
jgi:glycosyltransferase involved in cell wall biosynthesis